MEKKLSFLAFYFCEEGYDLIQTPAIFEKRALALTEMGFDGLELMVRDATQVDRAMLRRLAAQGVRYAALGTGKVFTADGLSFSDTDPAVRAAAVRRIQDTLDLAQELGGAPVILGSCRGDSTAPGAMERICACLEDCCRHAEQCGGRLALEPIRSNELPTIHRVDEALAVIERIGSPALGLTLDSCNMNVEEDSLEQATLRAAGHIFHVQVADDNRRYPSSGHIDFPRFLTALYRTGYDGYVSAELSECDDPLEDARRTLQYLRAVTCGM